MLSKDVSSMYLFYFTGICLGGTIVAAINLIKERGVENKQIKVVSRDFYISFFADAL